MALEIRPMYLSFVNITEKLTSIAFFTWAAAYAYTPTSGLQREAQRSLKQQIFEYEEKRRMLFHTSWLLHACNEDDWTIEQYPTMDESWIPVFPIQVNQIQQMNIKYNLDAPTPTIALLLTARDKKLTEILHKETR